MSGAELRETSSFSSSFSSCVYANFRTSCCARAELGFSLYCPHASLQNNDCDFLEFLNRNCCTHLWISSKSGVEKRVQLRLYNCILIFLTLIPRLPALASMVIICSSYVAIIHLLRLKHKGRLATNMPAFPCICLNCASLIRGQTCLQL